MLSPLLLLPPLASSWLPCHPLYQAIKPCSVALSAQDSDTTSSLYDSHSIDFYTQQVTHKANALDVKVFRGFSDSAKEYVAQQHLLNNDISEIQAVDIIMKNYYDNGDYKYSVTPHYGPETYFCAIYNGTEIDIDTQQLLFERTNGVVGVISAQLRRHPIHTPKIPTPHVYIANIRVDTKMKRKGIAMALLSAMQDYTRSLLWREDELYEGILPMVLSVDTDNLPAIKLYQKFGFGYLDCNDVFCMMTMCQVTK